jgi:hypothetical protein
VRRDLFEQFKQFSGQAVFEQGETRGVAAWSRQAVDVTGADRINDLHKHDRHRAGRLLHRPHRYAAGGQDDIRRERG